MTHCPREPLDAEERALAARLPRPHGRDEPGAGIDARILAAAHAAATSPLPAAPRRRRWGVPVGLVASLCLAAGLAWRVQLAPTDVAPAPAGTASQQAPDAPGADSAPPEEAVAVPPPSRPMPMMAPAAAPAPPARRHPLAETTPMPEPMPPLPDPASPAAGAAPAPAAGLPAPPAPPPPPPPGSAAPRALATESGVVPVARTPAAPVAAMAAKARAAQPAVLAQDAADAPEADVPPATADAPEVREAWLRRIAELQREGRTTEARASLAEFRRRYPETVLPVELRALETSAADPASH